MLRTSSALLDERADDSWRDLPQAIQAEAATKLVNSVESSALSLAKTVKEPTKEPIVNIELNISKFEL